MVNAHESDGYWNNVAGQAYRKVDWDASTLILF